MSNVTDLHLIQTINERLHQDYGRSLDGRSVWRLVWSDDQLEKRIGTFSDWYGHIFIREYTGLREVPKYPYIPHKWVMEKLTFLPPDSKIVKKHLVEAGNGIYEPIYVFKNAKGDALPVTWWAVEAILQALEHAGEYRQTDQDMWMEYHQQLDKDQDYFEEVLHEEGRTPLFADEATSVINNVNAWSRYNAKSESTKI